MLVGYARVSANHQNLDRQLGVLKGAGCERVQRDVGDAPAGELFAALRYEQPGERQTLRLFLSEQPSRKTSRMVALEGLTHCGAHHEQADSSREQRVR